MKEVGKANANANTGEAAKPVEKREAAESKYSAAEFAEAAEKGTDIFGAGVTQDIVTAAFFVAGKHEATKAEAQEIVKTFLRKGGKR